MYSKVQNIFFQRYLNNTAWLLMERFIRISIGFMINVLMARYLGASQYGMLNYGLSIVFLFSFLTSTAHEFIVIRDLVQKKYTPAVILGTAFFLRLMGAVLSLVLVAGWIFLIKHHPSGLDLVLILSLGTIFHAFSIVDFYFQSNVLSKYVVIVQFIQVLLSAALKLFLIYDKAPLYAFAWVIVFENAVFAFGMVIIAERAKGVIKSLTISRKLLGELFKESLPLCAGTLVLLIYMRLDQLMLAHYYTPAILGQYALAVNLCEMAYILPVVLAGSLFPAIILSKQISDGVYHKRLQHFFDFMTVLAVIIVGIVYIGSYLFFHSLFGPDFAVSADLLRIYILAFPFVCWGIICDKYLVNENCVHIVLIRILIGAVVNICLNATLIKYYGATGAAWTAVITVAVAVFCPFIFARTRKIVSLMLNSLWPFNRGFFEF